MSSPSRLRRVFRILLAAFGSTVLGLVIGVAILWRTGWFDRMELDVEARLIESYIRELQPHLPFQIEKFEVKKDWREVLRGHISEVSLVVRFQADLGRLSDSRTGWRLRMKGPVDLGPAPPDADHPTEKHYGVQFHPDAVMERLSPSGQTLSQSPPLALRLWIKATQSLRHVDDVGLETRDVRSWEWKPVGVKLEDFDLLMTWDLEDGKGQVKSRAKTLHWAGKADHEINITHATFKLETPFALSAEKPMKFGPEIHLGWSGGDAEVLWGETYLDLPLKSVPIDATARFEPEADSGKPRLRGIDARIGQGHSEVRVSAAIEKSGSGSRLRRNGVTRLRVTYKDHGLDLRDTLRGLLAATASAGPAFQALAPLRELEIRKGGRLHGDFSVEVPLDSASRPELSRATGQGRIEIRDAGLDWKKAHLAARGLNLLLPFSARQGVSGEISADAFGFRKYRGRLSKTFLSLKPDASRKGWALQVGAGATLPLGIEGVPLKIGSLQGHFGGGEDFHLKSSLSLAAMPLEKLLRLSCVTAKRIPPATAMAEMPEIEVGPGSIEPAGYARVELFDGFAEVSELGAYDLGNSVPEFDFSLRFNQIRLDQLGDWIGFGEMDGVLAGFAKDVTFQSWLPTRYELKLEAKPFSRNKVVFSPDAMKNFMRLIIEDTIDKLPGIADWLAFGWPSRLFSGYDVNYLGVYLFSQDGTILLETLDPPEIYKRERKHYILYGPRFKMPLISKHYPVAADASAAANLVHHMTHQVTGLMDSKEAKASKKKEHSDEPNQEETDCDPAL